MNIEVEDIENSKIIEEENIYQKLARATARAIDIELGKTTLADLLDGYTKSIVLQQIIDKAIEYIKENTKNDTFCEWYDGEVKDLLEILRGKENE